MASIKELRQKIGSLKNTNKITSAMKLVASSKLKKAQDALNRNSPYLNNLNGIVQRVIRSVGGSSFDLLKPAKDLKNIRVILLSSDKGLCGSFNAALFKTLQNQIKGDWSHLNVEVIALGRKGSEYFSRRFPVKNLVIKPGIPAKVPVSIAQELTKSCVEDFRAKKIDAVYLVYNHFVSMISQQPTINQILPVTLPKDEGKGCLDYIYEPDTNEMLNLLIPQLVQSVMFRSMLESVLGFNAAQMNAMDSATKNSKDLIGRYTLSMNRARQTAITTELSEIVAGAESLKN